MNKVVWHIVNAFLLGAAVFFGAFMDGNISQVELIASVGAASLVIIANFKDFWNEEQTELCTQKPVVGLFKFI